MPSSVVEQAVTPPALITHENTTLPRISRRHVPMPANVAATWGAFLYEGLLACSQGLGRDKEVLRRWGMGCDELIAAACAFLPEVWRQIEPRWYEAQFPGVFEYEVIAPLGVSIGDHLLLNHGELPPRELVSSFITDLIADFFRGERHRVTPARDDLGGIAS